jgi:DNA-binding MarR family transcriptional regulator/GNAT superfamily N-acetyltransferase
MEKDQLQQIRRFNRLVTQRVGALEGNYLRRGRPLGEARLIFETGGDGVDVRALRLKLGLDSGYLSRLLQSLERQGLIAVKRGIGDGRRRRVSLTRKGRVERAAYDRLSDELAASMLKPLDPAQRGRLMAAMSEVELLIRAASVEIASEAPDSAEARSCLGEYFRELGARFEGGFHHEKEGLADAAEMAPPTGVFVLARLDGEAIGCGGLKRIDEAAGEIKRVWTAPKARGMGVARRMLRMLEAAARDMGLNRLRLDTNRALKEAYALYRKEGFREIARFNDNPYAHLWFEKRL